MTWRDEAACVGRDDIDWFPGGSKAERRRPEAVQNLAAARKVCAACPVRAECLADELARGAEQHGFRAGLTEDERYAMREPKRRQVAVCGTPGGHRAHLRRGEPPCASCRRAHADDMADRRATA